MEALNSRLPVGPNDKGIAVFLERCACVPCHDQVKVGAIDFWLIYVNKIVI